MEVCSRIGMEICRPDGIFSLSMFSYNVHVTFGAVLRILPFSLFILLASIPGVAYGMELVETTLAWYSSLPVIWGESQWAVSFQNLV